MTVWFGHNKDGSAPPIPIAGAPAPTTGASAPGRPDATAVAEAR
jgi:hypothetical protein